ncbi:MAG: hypothetical protein WCY82_10355 [Desulfotomaculaceae bacterium]
MRPGRQLQTAGLLPNGQCTIVFLPGHTTAQAAYVSGYVGPGPGCGVTSPDGGAIFYRVIMRYYYILVKLNIKFIKKGFPFGNITIRKESIEQIVRSRVTIAVRVIVKGLL